MSLFVDTTYRSKEEEIMDDLDMSGDMLIKTLDQIAGINKWLGGNKVTLNGIQKLLKDKLKDESIVIVDLGCGNGDMLRAIAEFGRNNNFRFQLLGIDANQTTVDYAIELSKEYPEIAYCKQDVLSDSFKERKYDVVLCTLFLHHFDNDVIMKLLNTMISNSRLGAIVNDLHRHRLAYYLFKLVALVINNRMVTNDGLLSILRGFKREDINQFISKINYKSTVEWKWAFRYQWIIKK